MSRRSWPGVIVLVALTSLSAWSPVRAASHHDAMRADLDGRPIKLAEVGQHYCHDFDAPWIHCFSTPEALEASLAGSSESRSTSTVVVAYGPSDYVTIYADPSYSGAYLHLAQNYDTLFTIGWNDRVSSFRARNSASGTFWSDWFESGSPTNFCCNTNVASLPAGTDNTFTSVYRH